jgi:hypothetical protein
VDPNTMTVAEFLQRAQAAGLDVTTVQNTLNQLQQQDAGQQAQAGAPQSNQQAIADQAEAEAQALRQQAESGQADAQQAPPPDPNSEQQAQAIPTQQPQPQPAGTPQITQPPTQGQQA